MNNPKHFRSWVLLPLLTFVLLSQPAILAQITNVPPPSQATSSLPALNKSASLPNQAKRKTIPEFLAQSLLTVLGGGIAGAIGILSANYTRKQNAKFAFRVSISQIFGMCDPNPVALADFYRTSKSEIRVAVLQLRPLLNKSEVVKLETLWNEYDGLDPSDLSWERGVDVVSTALQRPKPTVLVQSFRDRFCKL